jgi:hypothetical protein
MPDVEFGMHNNEVMKNWGKVFNCPFSLCLYVCMCMHAYMHM